MREMRKFGKERARGRRWAGALVCGAAAGMVMMVATALARPESGAPAAGYAVVHAFDGAYGSFPISWLAVDEAGNLYGVTPYGGNMQACREYGNPLGCGVVFEINAAGEEKVVHEFTGPAVGGADGAYPEGPVTLDGAGNIYGTTENGGSYGYGTVYKVDAAGNETILHSFGARGDGAYATGGLVLDSAGNLYGTTDGGGRYGYGAAFELTAAGQEAQLYSFIDFPSDGAGPVGTLTRDSAGNFYGATYQGGTGEVGTVYELDANFHEKVLYNFTGKADGGYPVAGVVRNENGDLYGAAQTGGGGACVVLGCGTVYRLSASGKFTVLHTFQGMPDGSAPEGALTVDGRGTLYSTTLAGGANGDGTIYSVSTSGTEAVVYSFKNTGDGLLPGAGLVRDAKGNLYGTTGQSHGLGSCDCGVVFKLTP